MMSVQLMIAMSILAIFSSVFCQNPVIELSAKLSFDMGIVTCNVANMPSSASVEFSKGSPSDVSFTPISSEAGKYYVSNGKTLDDGSINYVLLVSDFEMADEGDYRCTVRDDEMDPQDWPFKQVHLKYTARPSIDFLGFRHELDVGQDFELTCTANGVPEPSVTWEKEGNDEFRSVGPVLHIPSVTKDDSGVYFCIADNNIGVPARSETVIDVKYYPPEVTAVNTTITTGRGWGKTAKLECTVDGVPLAWVIFWKITDQGRQRITGDNDKYYIKSNYVDSSGSTLTKDIRLFIAKLELSDSGTYVCKAENRLGSDEVEFTVQVQ